MLVFGRISQWSADIEGFSQLAYRGQFDLIKPKRNKVVAELWANPVSVRYEAEDGADPEGAEILEGMFRADMADSDEALETAVMDQVDCGFGAFRFCTEYESKFDDMSNLQRIRMEPINEANNVVYFDDNAKRKDKSDADWCTVITSFTRDGWKRYCEQNGIDYEKHKMDASFKAPNSSVDSFFFRNDTKTLNIGEFYHRIKKRKRVLVYEDPVGQRKAFYQDKIKEVADDLIDGGYIKIGEKYKDRYEVTKYILTGDGIVKSQRVVGEYIPIIPVFGDHSYVEKREIWRGIYHDAQDAQVLHNFQMSYLADMVAQGAREKPIFTPEQIKGFEWMYTLNGADNNYPYMLQNFKDSDGNPLPLGPVSYLQNPTMPQAGAALLDATRRSVDDVTGGQASTDQMVNSQVTEGQLMAMQSMQNMETFIYQNNLQLAMKHAGRVYASMAAELYDVPREVTIRMPDGSTKKEMVMETVLDAETGEEVTLKDITSGSFKVVTDTGPNYSTQREKTRQQMEELAGKLQGTPIGEMALLYYVMMLDGPMTEGLREWAKEQLMIMGRIEPETDEEIAKMQQLMQQQAQQAQQPDPASMMAMAEQAKAEADMAKVQSDAAIAQAKAQIDAYNAETKRIDVMASNQLKQVDAAKKASEIRGNELDNIGKLAQAFMPSRTLQ